VVATAAATVVVVGLLTVTVQAGSLDQLPQAVEELPDFAGSTLQLPQVVEVLLAGSALQVPQVVDVLSVGSALQVPQVVELDVLAGSALQVPQEVLLEELAAAFFVGSALQLLQLARPKPPVAELQVELLQVPKL
jgi:hypothetical protein